jgi:flagellin-like hook-associated protein FlgL
VLIQTQIARGRIFDADAAREASRLAKQQILAGAASQTISLASVQKRGLIDMLI